MICPTSHIEADGQLVNVHPATSNPNTFCITTIEIFDGHHISLDPMVLACPTCHTYVARPYDPNLPFPQTDDGRKEELALCGK